MTTTSSNDYVTQIKSIWLYKDLTLSLRTNALTQYNHSASGEKGRIEAEGRVLRGGTNKSDDAFKSKFGFTDTAWHSKLV